MTFQEDMDAMAFVAEEVEKGHLPLEAVSDLATKHPRVVQLRQMIAHAIAWGRAHPAPQGCLPFSEGGDAPPAFGNRFDGIEI